MGFGERLVVISIGIIIIVTSCMMFTLGVFFLQNRKKAEEYFLKSFAEQLKSLSFFRGVPLFGELYYIIAVWYTKIFPALSSVDESPNAWMHHEHEKPLWLTPLTVGYFVWVMTGAILLYSTITMAVAIFGIYLMNTLP